MSFNIMGVSDSDLRKIDLHHRALDIYLKNPKQAVSQGGVYFSGGKGGLLCVTLETIAQTEAESLALQEYRKAKKQGIAVKGVKTKSSVPGYEEEKEFSPSHLVKLDRNDKALQQFRDLDKTDELAYKIPVNDLISGKQDYMSVPDAISYNKKIMKEHAKDR